MFKDGAKLRRLLPVANGAFRETMEPPSDTKDVSFDVNCCRDFEILRMPAQRP